MGTCHEGVVDERSESKGEKWIQETLNHVRLIKFWKGGVVEVVLGGGGSALLVEGKVTLLVTIVSVPTSLPTPGLSRGVGEWRPSSW